MIKNNSGLFENILDCSKIFRLVWEHLRLSMYVATDKIGTCIRYLLVHVR